MAPSLALVLILLMRAIPSFREPRHQELTEGQWPEKEMAVCLQCLYLWHGHGCSSLVYVCLALSHLWMKTGYLKKTSHCLSNNL